MVNGLALDKNVTNIESKNLMLLVEQGEINLKDWAILHRKEIDRWLDEQGALVIRGLRITSSRQFSQILEVLFGEPLVSYSHRSTPRTELRGNVYTASEYHSEQTILQHNEQAYTNVWPTRIGFFCMQPSQVGGETPIADSREIYALIPPEIRRKFEDKGVMYVRNFSNIDLPWEEVFCTSNKEDVESYCLSNDIQFEWLDNGGLKTKQVLPATCKHPHTQESLWFNQAHLFHVSALEAELRNSLVSSLGVDGLPRHTFYGDGSEIADKDLEVIRAVYEQAKVSFEWQKGDLMLLDNMLFSHGRMPFSGERQILVGMSKTFDVSQAQNNGGDSNG
jgi:alpha-ketoglutarate-dependent taurine dioxygenase